jgi:hypothetical protein
MALGGLPARAAANMQDFHHPAISIIPESLTGRQHATLI